MTTRQAELNAIVTAARVIPVEAKLIRCRDMVAGSNFRGDGRTLTVSRMVKWSGGQWTVETTDGTTRRIHGSEQMFVW